jgi:hypothetical protein
LYWPKVVYQLSHRVGESQKRNSNYPDNGRDDLWRRSPSASA